MLAALLVLALVSSAFSTFQTDPDFPAFRRWQLDHGKFYNSVDETENRFTIWKQNRDIANLRNAKGGATHGLNKFSDLSSEEFAAKYLLPKFKPTPESERVYLNLPRNIQAPPQTFDWRNLGKVTAIKDQGQCGSCWAFSVTENIESVWMISKGITNSSMPALSPQQIVDCDGEDGGCNGGDTPTAYEYVIGAGGLERDSDYPYTANDGSCEFDSSRVFATISSWKYGTTQGDESTMVEAVATVSPLSICVDASTWSSYTGGVMTADQCGQELDHCVQIIGYNLQSSTPYWLVRNSWNTDWGENGLIRLAYGSNTCGCTDEATTAVA